MSLKLIFPIYILIFSRSAIFLRRSPTTQQSVQTSARYFSPSRGLHLKHCALMIVNLTNFVSASPRWRYRKIESAKKKPRYDSSKINNKKPRNLCREQFEITYMHSENGIKFDGKHRFPRSTVRRLNRNFRLFGFQRGA